MKYKKTLLAGVVAAGILAIWKFNHRADLPLIAKPTQTSFSPDEVKPDEALAIAAQVEAERDFSGFIYECDAKRLIAVLIEHSGTTPKARLIMQMTKGEAQAKHRYVTHANPWGFRDVFGTDWTISAGALTGKGGTYDGTVCKFNLDLSTEFDMNSKKENVVDQFGV